MKQTAVRWLVEKLRVEFGFSFSNNILEQAKEMEKQQIIDAHIEGFYSPPFNKSRKGEAEQYYNETFNK